MKDTFYLEFIKFKFAEPEVREKIQIAEGDVILEKENGIMLLPAYMDMVKSIEKRN